ncbi:MAG TPA: type II toxin-antitoxin system RelE/ParE family toxin [Actinomycetota bacterium]|nr:type II toxin-antitoxin system RelE/ParE family toxin [Actinomycetota bacterium]
MPSTTPSWRIHFFRRHVADDAAQSVPARAFLDALPRKVAAEFHAVLDAVAQAPPPSFSGGGKWEAMHGDMAGLYEIRIGAGDTNFRLFCILERDAADLGGSSIIVLGGLQKRRREAASQREYRRIRQLATEFSKRRSVLP